MSLINLAWFCIGVVVAIAGIGLLLAIAAQNWHPFNK